MYKVELKWDKAMEIFGAGYVSSCDFRRDFLTALTITAETWSYFNFSETPEGVSLKFYPIGSN